MSILAYILHLLLHEPAKAQACLRKTIIVVNREQIVAYLPCSIHFLHLVPFVVQNDEEWGISNILNEKCKDLPLKMKSILAYYFSFTSLHFESPHQSSTIVVFFSCTQITCEDVAYYFLSSKERPFVFFFFSLSLSLLHWCFNLGFPKSWNWKTLLIWEFAAWMTVNCDKSAPLGFPHLWPW